MPSILIVGGSDAGVSAALRARELAPEAQVRLLLADRYPSFSICGIPFLLSGEVDGPSHLAHHSARDIEAAGIDLLPGHRARSLDPETRVVQALTPGGDTRDLRYDRLLIATGATSVRPPIAGMDLPGVFTLRWMDEALAVRRWLERQRPERAVIVGGGYIGMEMADALTRRGMAVTLVEALPQILATLDPDLAVEIAVTLRNEGVEVVTGVRTERIRETSEGLRVETGAGSWDCGLVLVATGARPETTIAAAAGLETGHHGALRVDRHMRTRFPSVYAAGDCVETWHRLLEDWTYMPLGSTAHKQGRIAGENLVGGAREFAGTLGTQVVKVFDRIAARTGLHDRDARAAGFDPLSVDLETWDRNAYYPGAQKLIIRVTGERRDGRLLGAQILGHQGSEVAKRLDVFATALFHGMKVVELEDLDLSYTPPLSSPWDPVQMAARHWTWTLTHAGGSR